jgi:hypothetical protein
VYELYPTLKWDFTALARQTQSMPGTLSFNVWADGKPIGERSERVRVRSVNDVPYYIYDSEDEDAEALDFNFLFAAYVNEDHPIVDDILREALETGIVESFDGYQSEDPEQVYLQVFAIWHVMQKRGIRYSSITATANQNAGIESQHVRLIDQSLRAKQANCVDGSVLFASILRKIDIAPFLVLVPGHMFMGFYLDSEQETPTFLETTMLGDAASSASARDVESMRSVRHGGGVDMDASWETFEAAVSSGTESVEEVSDKFDSDDPEYQFIDIQAAREMGVTPISGS